MEKMALRQILSALTLHQRRFYVGSEPLDSDSEIAVSKVQCNHELGVILALCETRTWVGPLKKTHKEIQKQQDMAGFPTSL